LEATVPFFVFVKRQGKPKNNAAKESKHRSMEFKERMTGEIMRFIQSQARAVSLDEIDRLNVNLPTLRQRFAAIPAQTYPYLADQLRFLSRVVGDRVRWDPAAEMVGEAAFALLYFQRASDLIPDSIPGIGLLDDEIIVRFVLGRHGQAFKASSHGYNPRWPAPSFEVDQLLSVVSPLRLSLFCQALASRAGLPGPECAR
jgi:uncharacterized membrane protein YkvA (DUF1232 family)